MGAGGSKGGGSLTLPPKSTTSVFHGAPRRITAEEDDAARRREYDAEMALVELKLYYSIGFPSRPGGWVDCTLRAKKLTPSGRTHSKPSIAHL